MTAQTRQRANRQPVNGTLEHQDSKGRFTKGNKANPDGAAAQTSKRKKSDISAYCKRNSMRAAKAIMAVVNDPKASAAERIKGAQYIIDRAFGKPETAGNAAQGLFAGATILVDTGIRRERQNTLESPFIDAESHAVTEGLNGNGNGAEPSD